MYGWVWDNRVDVLSSEAVLWLVDGRKAVLSVLSLMSYWMLDH